MSTFGMTLIGLRVQARYMGLEIESPEMNKFLAHVAELIDATEVREREAMRTIHKPLTDQE